MKVFTYFSTEMMKLVTRVTDGEYYCDFLTESVGNYDSAVELAKRAVSKARESNRE